MKLSTILLTSILLTTGCSSILNNSSPKQPIIYTSDTHQEWKQEVLDACKDESIVMTLFLYEAKGRLWTEQDVKDVEKFLLGGCLYNKNVTI